MVPFTEMKKKIALLFLQSELFKVGGGLNKTEEAIRRGFKLRFEFRSTVQYEIETQQLFFLFLDHLNSNIKIFDWGVCTHVHISQGPRLIITNSTS